IRAAAAAGHSAGEYAAHVAAGSLPFDDGLRLIRLRGEAMARAGTDRPGTMAAVLGLSAEQIDEVLRTVNAPHDLAAANYKAPVGRAAFPVYANVTAGPVMEPDAIRRTLREQLLKPVRWEQTMRAMVEQGIRRYIEVGNGRVLRGLLRGVDKEAQVFGTDDPDALEAAVQGLAEAAAR